MRFFNWLWDCWKSFWGKVFFIGALLFTAMILCWIIGWQCNFLIIGAFLLGLWAVNKVAKKLNPKIEPKELLKDIYWYIAIFVCTAGFFLTFFKSSLLYMYLDWSTAHRGIAGFAQIFASIIVLTVASVALATVAQTRKFTIIWFWFCLISSAVGLMGFRLVRPFDQLGGAKQEQLAEKLDAVRMKMEKASGLRAVIINYQAEIYENKSSLADLFEPYPCDPNGVKFKREIGTVLSVLKKDLVKSTKSTEKFVEVEIAGEVRWFNANDVVVVPAGDVNLRKGECAVVRDGNTLTVFCMSNEPFLVEFPKGWGEVIAKYDKIYIPPSTDPEDVSYLEAETPMIKLGQKFRSLPYMGMCGIREKVFLQGRMQGDKIIFYNNK